MKKLLALILMLVASGCSTLTVKTHSQSSALFGDRGEVVLIYDPVSGLPVDYAKQVEIITLVRGNGNLDLRGYMIDTKIKTKRADGAIIEFETGAVGDGAKITSDQLDEMMKTLQGLTPLLKLITP